LYYILYNIYVESIELVNIKNKKEINNQVVVSYFVNILVVFKELFLGLIKGENIE
jgi:hypothetical protein